MPSAPTLEVASTTSTQVTATATEDVAKGKKPTEPAPAAPTTEVAPTEVAPTEVAPNAAAAVIDNAAPLPAEVKNEAADLLDNIHEDEESEEEYSDEGASDDEENEQEVEVAAPIEHVHTEPAV